MSRFPLWHLGLILLGLIICTALVLLHVPASMLLPWFFLAIISVLTADAVLGAGTGIAATVLSGFLLYAVPPNGRPVPLGTILLAEAWVFGTCLLVWILTQRLRWKVYALALERENMLPVRGGSIPGPHHLYARLIDEAPDGVVVVDSAGLIVLANQEIENLFGYTRDDLLGKTVDIFLPPPLRESHNKHHEGYLAAPTRRPMGTGRDLVAQRKDGSTFPVDVSLSPLHRGPEGGGTVLVKAVVRDITQRKEMQEALALEQVGREEAERTLEDQTIFLSIVAHELRTPLTSLSGYSELLSEYTRAGDALDLHVGDPVPPEYGALRTQRVRAVDAIARQSDKLGALVNRLLDFARLSRGTLVLHKKAGDLRALVHDVVRSVQETQTPAGRMLTLIEDSSVSRVKAPIILLFDSLRMEQVLVNLCDNAFKYGAGDVVVRLESDETDVHISVEDRGPGIPPDVQGHVFEKFYRGEHMEKAAGLGLGLFLVHQIVTLHGGSVAILDNPGGGTRVAVRLPLGLAHIGS